MGYTKRCSHPFPFTLTPLPPFLTDSGRCMCCLSHPFPIRIQILSHKSIHLLPFQSIISPCILRVYVLYIPVCLCAFVLHVSMCLCNSFLCTYCLCLFLQMPLYVAIPQDYLFKLCFFKHACNATVLFLVLIFLPWFLCRCLPMFSSHVVRAQRYLEPKKIIFSIFHWFVFKRLSWAFTFSTVYFEMVLLRHIQPTFIQISLPERKVKKSTYGPFF